MSGRARADEAVRDTLVLSLEEREPVGALAEAYAAAVPGGRAAAYRELAAAARSGAVPSELIDVLERVCTVALETGKARELGRAEAERVLAGVFRRTPGGRASSAALEGVNRALAELAGRRLGSARASMRLPGTYALVLEVEGLSLTLGLGPAGIRVEHVVAS